MAIKKYLPYLLVISLLAGSLFATRYFVDVEKDNDVPVLEESFQGVGDWVAHDVYYCQNESCMKSFMDNSLNQTNSCTVCGGRLERSWSLAEFSLLSADTVLIKKVYVNSSGDQLMVSVVISGNEQGSIHRPQMCLTGQGYDIVSEQKRDVLVKGSVLDFNVLDVVRRFRGDNDSLRELKQYYIYWFVSKERETASNRKRIVWAAMDRILKGKASRWAYISILGPGNLDSEAGRSIVEDFLPQLHSMVIRRNR